MSHPTLVVGLGRIGMGYDIECEPQIRIATLSRAFDQHSEFDLVGGVDLCPLRRELFTTNYSRPVYSSVAEALEENDPSVVAIAVPTEAHNFVFHQILRAPNIKAILCEKPLSYSLEEAIEMVQLSSRVGVRLYTNYMRRCDQAVIELKRRFSHGQIAGPIKGVCWYSNGLFNNGSHFLNLLQFWLGDVIYFEIIDPGPLLLNGDPEPDFKVHFELGEIYFHAVCDENFSFNCLELVAANGRLRYETGYICWYPVDAYDSKLDCTLLNPVGEFICSDSLRLQWFVADEIAKDLLGKVTTVCTGSQALSTLQILDQIRQKL